jgi:hypothetical protein
MKTRILQIMKHFNCCLKKYGRWCSYIPNDSTTFIVIFPASFLSLSYSFSSHFLHIKMHQLSLSWVLKTSSDPYQEGPCKSSCLQWGTSVREPRTSGHMDCSSVSTYSSKNVSVADMRFIWSEGCQWSNVDSEDNLRLGTAYQMSLWFGRRNALSNMDSPLHVHCTRYKALDDSQAAP